MEKIKLINTLLAREKRNKLSSMLLVAYLEWQLEDHSWKPTRKQCNNESIQISGIDENCPVIVLSALYVHKLEIAFHCFSSWLIITIWW